MAAYYLKADQKDFEHYPSNSILGAMFCHQAGNQKAAPAWLLYLYWVWPKAK